MTKHKKESKAERELRRRAEHHERVWKERHLNPEKAQKILERKTGKHAKRICSTFSDKEMEEASMLGSFIAKSIDPEDGLTYEELATFLWTPESEVEDRLDDISEITTRQRYGDDYISKIDRLLYVLKYLVLDFAFNTTEESWEKERGGRRIPMIPCVRTTSKLRNGDRLETVDPVRVIFNGFKKKYSAEEILKISEETSGSSYEESEMTEEEKSEVETILQNLKNLKGPIKTEGYIEELGQLVEQMQEILAKCDDKNGIEETELMHIVIPESIGKTGKDLEPYVTKFNDAMYLWYKSVEPENPGLYDEWKADHGYLEGR